MVSFFCPRIQRWGHIVFSLSVFRISVCPFVFPQKFLHLPYLMICKTYGLHFHMGLPCDKTFLLVSRSPVIVKYQGHSFWKKILCRGISVSQTQLVVVIGNLFTHDMWDHNVDKFCVHENLKSNICEFGLMEIRKVHSGKFWTCEKSINIVWPGPKLFAISKFSAYRRTMLLHDLVKLLKLHNSFTC